MSFWYETVRETCSCGASIELPYDTGTNHKIDEWRREHKHDKPRPELKSLNGADLSGPVTP